MKGTMAGYVIPPPLAESPAETRPVAQTVSTKHSGKKKASSKAVKAG
jgi:hypothetical protein